MINIKSVYSAFCLQIELENLNSATDEINKLEIELEVIIESIHQLSRHSILILTVNRRPTQRSAFY